jgi:tetratricopeptide (TPR) repeat protein
VEDPMTRARIYTALAPLLDREDDPRMARELLSRAEEIANSTEDSRLDVGLKTAWGHHYQQSNEFDAAQDSFKKALEMTSNEADRVTILNPLGQTQRAMGNNEIALKTFIESADLMENAKKKQQNYNLADQYQAFQNIAELYQEMGQTREADAAADRLDTLKQELKEAGEPVDEIIARYADFNLTTRLVPDIPTAEDSLNFKPLVEALGNMLSDPNTKLPLAIALTAPWGGGKSSLMRQLQKYLTVDRKNATGRQWQSVWFDAWKYETNEQVWASMAKHIYDYPEETMSRWKRINFRIWLERNRGKISRDVVVTVLTIGFVILAGYIGKNWETISNALPFLTAGGVLVAMAGFFSRYGTELWQPFKRAMNRHAEIRKKYSERRGFTAEASDDIGHLVDAIVNSQYKDLIIFVDDLDRCSPNHVASVVEAINQIFNSDAERQCAFILGMDRDVVVASIRHEYRHVIGQLQKINPVLAYNFGDNFLGKIVQATIQIPPPTSPALAGLLSKITGNDPPESLVTEHKQFDKERVQKAIRVIKKAELNNPVDAEKQRTEVEKNMPDIRSEDVDEAMRQVRADLLTSDSADVSRAQFAVLEYLPPNPRTLKRFDNMFRLQLHVTNNTPGARIKFHYEELEAMARWVALRFRWPDLARLIDKEPILLQNLDHAINEGAAPSDRIKKWMDDDLLIGLLTPGEKGTRISDLPFDTFLRIT